MSGDISISAFSIGVTLDAIVVALLVLYLQTLPSPKRSTRFLALALSGVGAAFLMLAVNFSSTDPFISQIALTLVHLAIFGIHGFVMFAYEFLGNIHPDESRRVEKISLIASVFGFVYYGAAAASMQPVYIFEGELYYYDIAVPGIIIGVQFGWMFAVLFRKAAFFAQPEGKRSLRTVIRLTLTGEEERAVIIRRFMAGFVWVLPVPMFIVFATVGWMSWVVSAYIMALGILALLTWLVLFYFRYSGETTTFLVKQVGLFLLSTTTIIGIVGVITVEDQKRTYHDLRAQESLKRVENPAAAAPERLLALYRLEETPALVYRKTDWVEAVDLANARWPAQGEPLFVKASDTRPDSFALAYRVETAAGAFAVLYAYDDYRAWVSQTALKVLIALALAVALALFLFPPILRQTILAPINRLLGGVRQVNGGDLTVKVEVDSQDEIGYLTESFNGMVANIAEARDELQRYAENLEELVEERTAELRTAKDQTDRIFAHVEEGLFLLFQSGGEFRLGSQYSKALLRMLRAKDIAERDFASLLTPYLSAKVIGDLQKYLRLMFRPAMSEEMLSGLNPLEKVELLIGGDRRHLRFRFVRIFKEGEVTHLLGSAQDATEEMRLHEALEQSRLQGRHQTEILLKLLNCDPLLLRDFMTGARNDYALVQKLLEEQLPAQEKIDALYRSIHSIKGNAAMLDLDFVAFKAHGVEEDLRELQERAAAKGIIPGEAFAPLVGEIAALGELLDQTEALIERITLFAARDDTADSLNKTVFKALENLLTRTAETTGKKAALASRSFDLAPLGDPVRIVLKDVLVQLVRNCVAHGIEKPDLRLERGKGEAGTVTLTTLFRPGSFELIVEDDGNGLDLYAIRQRAIALGLIDSVRSFEMKADEVTELIFVSGFSTAKETDMAAGRGVGMDIVRSKLRELGGDILLETFAGQGTRFTITLPKGADA